MTFAALSVLALEICPSSAWAVDALQFQSFITTANGETVVPILCGADPYRPCSEVTPPLVSLITNSDPKNPGIVEKDITTYFYQGHQPDPTQADGISKTVTMNTPICDLATGEVDTNLLGQSCGTSCQFHCQKASDGTSSCSMDAASCQKERAWSRGVLIEMIKDQAHHLTQDEITTQHAVHVDGPCAVSLSDPSASAVITSLSSTMGYWSQNYHGQPTCDLRGGTTQPSGTSLDPGEQDAPAQASCYMATARDAIEKVAGTIAICEIFKRADDAWRGIAQSTFDQIPVTVSNQAHDDCKSGYKGDVNAFQQCLQSHYDNAIQQAFIDGLAPYQAAAASAPLAPAVPGAPGAPKAAPQQPPSGGELDFGSTGGSSGGSSGG